MKAVETESFVIQKMKSYPPISGVRYGSLFDATQTMVSQIGDDLYRYRLFPGMTMKNSIQARWFVRSKYFAELS